MSSLGHLLIQAPSQVAEAAAHRVIRYNGTANFVGDEDADRATGSRRMHKVHTFCVDIHFLPHHQIADPKSEAVDQQHVKGSVGNDTG